MKKMVILVLLIALGGILTAQTAPTLRDSYTEVMVTAGAWLHVPSEVWFAGDWHTKNISPLIKASYGVNIIENFYIGGVLNIAPYYTYTNYYDDNFAGFVELAAVLAARIFISDDFVIRPGVEIGNRFAWGEYWPQSVDGVGINFTVECQQKIGDFIFVVNPGFLSQVSGYENMGGFDFWLEYAPIFYLNVGFSVPLMWKN